MKNGTLDFKVASNGRLKFKVTGFQSNLILDRVVPDSWSDDRDVLEFEVNLQNTRYLRMVQTEYPLEVLNKEKWEECLDKLARNEEIEQNIEQLQLKEPDKSAFNGELMNFQKEGLDFLLKTNGNALLADEMGLGKTIQTIAFLATAKNTLPCVVVSPLVTLWNWERELKKFFKVKDTKGLTNGELMTPVVNIIRKGKPSPLPPAHIHVINYELMGKRVDDLIAIKPRTIVCDEVQNLRNIRTIKFQAIDQLAKAPSVEFRLALSGTPIYNKGSEIWGIVDILQHGLLGSYNDFKGAYCSHWDDTVLESKQKALYQVLSEHVMLRRKKTEVLHDLPEKNRYQQRIHVDMEYYQTELDKLFNRIEEAKSAIESAKEDEKKQKIMELAKSYTSSIQQERQIAGIAKAPYVIEYLRDMMELEEKIVVFVHHIAVHEMLMRGMHGWDPLQIIGGQKDSFRQDQIDLFQNDPDRKLIICGNRAGNMGINLTSGNYVVFGELDWSPSVHKQAEDRLHRIGQKSTVFAHYLIGENTMDESIANKLTDKALEIDAVLGDKPEIYNEEKSTKILTDMYQKLKNKNKSKIRTLIQN